MSIDEGYVKYASDWTKGPPPDADAVTLLERWRAPLREAGLIGYDETHHVGYGNLSVRFGDEGAFVVSATQTGQLASTTPEHYALVTAVDAAANRVSSTGPMPASSEAMTHAALYAASPRINAVVHVHSSRLFSRCRHTLPATDPGVAYGTPEMAAEMARLVRDDRFGEIGIAVMAGHEGGLIGVGGTVEQAAKRVLALARCPVP